MSAFEAPALDAIAFQLAAAVERYEQDVARLLATWLDMELYAEISRQVEDMRLYSAALPQLSGAWVEVLIAHTELVHQMWRVQNAQPAPAPGELQEVRQRQVDAARALRTACLRLISRSAP